MFRRSFLLGVCFFVLNGVVYLDAHSEPIKLVYNERPPYLQSDDSKKVIGLTGTPTAHAFNQAGIPYFWYLIPSKRQLLEIKLNQEPVCSPGWFKNPEREKYGKYTRPIYQDKAIAILTQKDNQKVLGIKSIDDLLSHQNLLLIVKDGYSYGKFIDEKIAEFKPHIQKTTQENDYMVRYVYRKRADYMFISPEEAQGVIELAQYQQSDFKLHTLSDIVV